MIVMVSLFYKTVNGSTKLLKNCIRNFHCFSKSTGTQLENHRRQVAFPQLPISTSSIFHKQIQFRRGNKYEKPESEQNESHEDESNEYSDIDVDIEYEGLVKRTFKLPDSGHNVYVIQPYIKWGPKKKRNTTPELQLAEAVTLIKTLRNWNVVAQDIISLDSFNKFTLFGKGNLEKIKDTIRKSKQITSVFISVDCLKYQQHKFFETEFSVSCYDRYNIVIQIFREHAVTKEAKLQIQMAEVPYLYRQLKGFKDSEGKNSGMLRGGTETTQEIRQRIVKTKEIKIKNELAKLKEHRQLIRKNRKKLEYPIVAVVGYTNCGKTSLIKALTGAKKLQPRNELFATLDVTVHNGLLPSLMEVLYVDTIGFISDIPTNLIESFVATLEDAMFADIIIHVLDISHPDLKAQVEEVNKTLSSLKLSESILKNIVLVGNKIDLVTKDVCDNLSKEFNDKILFVSAETLLGTDDLREKLEEVLLACTGRSVLVIRAPSGGDEFKWLYKESNVTNVEADPKDFQYVFMKVIITSVKLAQFKNIFITQHKSR